MGMEVGQGFGPVKKAEIEAVIIRKDGTRVDLGRIAYWHKNPLRRWAWNLAEWLKRVKVRLAERRGKV